MSDRPLRPIQPAPVRTSSQDALDPACTSPGPRGDALENPRRRRVILVACEPCRKRKAKCSGGRVCAGCAQRGISCEYDADPETPRSVTLKRKSEAMKEELGSLRELVDLLRSRPEVEALEIFRRIRSGSDSVSLHRLLKDSELLVQPPSSTTPPADGQPRLPSVKSLLDAAAHQDQARLIRALRGAAQDCSSSLTSFETSRSNGSVGTSYNNSDVCVADALSLGMLESLRSILTGTDTSARLPLLERPDQPSDRSTSTSRSTSQHSYDRPQQRVKTTHPRAADHVITVPAKPWTNVTEDSRFVSHLMSLYFTWDHPQLYVLDRETFLDDMIAGDLDSQYCSPFLVNVILARACYYSDLPEACVVPGDRSTSGDHFFEEAKRLWEAEKGKASLINVEGLLMMLFKHGTDGNDRIGTLCQSQAIQMFNDLGLHLELKRPPVADADKRMQRARKIAAWGLINIVTIREMSLLKRFPTLKAPRLLGEEEMGDATIWSPYPLVRTSVPANLLHLFGNTTALLAIMSDVASLLYADQDEPVMGERWETAVLLHEKLLDWYRDLPSCLLVTEQIPAHVLGLHMLYHNIIMNLFGAFRGAESKLFFSHHKSRATRLCLSSAKEIAKFLRLHLRTYGSELSSVMLTQYASVCVSELLDHIGDSPDIPQLFHDGLIVLMGLARRIKLGKGIIMVIRRKADAARARAMLPETQQLFEDFDNNIWKKSDYRAFNSDFPDFSSAVRVKREGTAQRVRLGELLEMYEKLSIEER